MFPRVSVCVSAFTLSEFVHPYSAAMLESPTTAAFCEHSTGSKAASVSLYSSSAWPHTIVGLAGVITYNTAALHVLTAHPEEESE